ncbi:MAG: GNAT family N-acetyltransferase [Halanaerobiales bacterium]
MLEVKRVDNEIELEKVFELRYQVFVKEQGVPLSIERDKYDQSAEHVMALSGDKVVGCGRIVFNKDYGKIGRVAVDSEYRRQGVGRMICQELIQIARDQGSKKVILHAQFDSRDFYKKLGFKMVGDIFIEADIKHIKMEYVL